MKLFSVFVSLLLLFSCSRGSKIQDERNLIFLLGVKELKYECVFEYNGLKNEKEGIYLSKIRILPKELERVIQNLDKNKSENIDSGIIISNWKMSPMKDSLDRTIFDYRPLNYDNQRLLKSILADLDGNESYYNLIQEKKNVNNISLYVINMKKNEIKIFQTYF